MARLFRLAPIAVAVLSLSVTFSCHNGGSIVDPGESFNGGIVFALYYPGAGRVGSDICYIDPDAPTPVTRTLIANAAQPRVSPDGRRIMFSRIDSISLDVYVSDIEGRNQVNITHTDWDFSEEVGDWSPDGLKVCYIARNRGTMKTAIVIANPDGSNTTAITDTSTFELANLPRWSPDGSKIAFIGRDHGYDPYWLGVISVDGKDLRRFDQVWYASPLWSPGGQSVACTKLVGGRYILHILDVTTGQSSQLGPEYYMGNGSLFSWLSNDRLSCAAFHDSTRSVVCISLSPSTAVSEIAAGFRDIWTIVGSPGGERVAVMDGGIDTELSLYIAETGGSQSRRIASLHPSLDAVVDAHGYVAWIRGFK